MSAPSIPGGALKLAPPATRIAAVARLELGDVLRSRWLVFSVGLYAALTAAFVWMGRRESAILGFTGMPRLLLALTHALLRRRLQLWQERCPKPSLSARTSATLAAGAGKGDVVYCDPPYAYSQSILYGAHSFDLQSLWTNVRGAVDRGAHVALSLNGHWKNRRPQSSRPSSPTAYSLGS